MKAAFATTVVAVSSGLLMFCVGDTNTTARQLYARDPTAVLPPVLLDLEVQLGAAEGAPRSMPQADRLVEVLCRAVATAASGLDIATPVNSSLGPDCGLRSREADGNGGGSSCQSEFILSVDE